MSSRRQFHELIAAILTVFVFGCSRAVPEFEAGRTNKLTVVLDRPTGQTPGADHIVTDPVKIEKLLAILRGGQPTKDHKCGDSWHLAFDQRGGNRAHLGLLAGHDGRYYEFRIYRGNDYEIYRVERQPLLEVMASFGVTDLDLGGPEE